MTKNEIKKALYREKPHASNYGSTEHEKLYVAKVGGGFDVYFAVPYSDMGDQELFGDNMEAQLLIRWLV